MKKFLQALKSVFFILLGLCFLISCASVSQQTPASLPAPIVKTAQASITPSAVALTLQPTLTPAPTAARNVPLSTQGPWFAYQSKGEMIAVNVDGTGRTVIPKSQQLPEGYTSPDGEWIATKVTADPELKYTHGIDLMLYRVSTGISLKIASLLKPETVKNGNNAAEENKRFGSEYEVFLAVTKKDSVAWSPNGEYLAFVGAMDGPSADLYVHEIKTQKLKRLTDGTNQAATLLWSPDSKWIVHKEVRSLFSIASDTVIWAAKVDGSEVKKITTTDRPIEEVVIGWMPTGELIMGSRALESYINIRLIKIESGKVKVLEAKRGFSGIAYDPKSNTLAFSISNGYEVLSDPDAGVYFASPPDAPMRQVLRCRLCGLNWDPEADLFFVATLSPAGPWAGQNVVSLTPTGLVTVFSQVSDSSPSMSPDKKWLAFRKRTDITVYTIYGDRLFKNYQTKYFPYLILWHPDSKGFFFVQYVGTKKEIYYAGSDNGIPSNETVLVDKIGSDEIIYGWITKWR